MLRRQRRLLAKSHGFHRIPWISAAAGCRIFPLAFEIRVRHALADRRNTGDRRPCDACEQRHFDRASEHVPSRLTAMSETAVAHHNTRRKRPSEAALSVNGNRLNLASHQANAREEIEEINAT